MADASSEGGWREGKRWKAVGLDRYGEEQGVPRTPWKSDLVLQAG